MIKFWIAILISLSSYASTGFGNITIGVFYNQRDVQAEIPMNSLIYTANLMGIKLQYEAKIKQVHLTDIYQLTNTVCDMLSVDDGLSAVISPSSSMVASMTQSICSELEIPYLQIHPTSLAISEMTSVNFYPRLDELARAMGEIVKNLDWKSFVILYQSPEDLVLLKGVLALEKVDLTSDTRERSIILKEIGPGPDYRNVFKEVKDLRENFILLHCKTEMIMEILLQAKSVGMMEKFHRYFLTSLDAHTINYENLQTSANITTVRIFDPETPELKQAIRNWELYEHNQGRPLEISPYEIKTSTILMHDAISHYIDAVKILHHTGSIASQALDCNDISGKWKEGFRIASYMKVKPPANALSQPAQFDSTGQRSLFRLYLIQGFRNGTQGYWDSEEKKFTYLISRKTLEKILVENIKAHKMMVASRLGQPYLRLKKPSFEGEVLIGNAQYEGYSMDIISEIANIIGFKFEFYMVPDGQIGFCNPKTKEWNGVIREILDHRADLAITDLTMTHQRRSAVDFSMPFMSLGIAILYKKPTAPPFNMFKFFEPFSGEVWAYTATLYLTVSIILVFVYRMAPQDWENPHPCDENPEELENIWNLKNAFWLTLGSTLQQGCDLLPKAVSSRMATSMWWFFALIMASTYTANLAAFLTIANSGPSIGSVEDLASQTKIKYGCMEGGSTQTFFKEATYATYEKMHTNMMSAQPSVFVKTNDDGVKRVQTAKNDGYAFLMESTQIEYEIRTKCDLRQIGNLLDSKFYAIAMPMKSSYIGLVNKAILQLSETGKLDELKKKWWEDMRDEPVCEEDTGETEDAASQPLALQNLGGVFLLLGVGTALAYFIAIAEFLWNVKNVATEEHLSFREALRIELKFALNFWITKKQTKCPTPSASSSSSSTHSQENGNRSKSILENAGSLFNLNRIK